MPGRRGTIENVAGEIVKGFEVIETSGLNSYISVCAAQQTLKESIVKSIKEGSYELDYYGDDYSK